MDYPATRAKILWDALLGRCPLLKDKCMVFDNSKCDVSVWSDPLYPNAKVFVKTLDTLLWLPKDLIVVGAYVNITLFVDNSLASNVQWSVEHSSS